MYVHVHVNVYDIVHFIQTRTTQATALHIASRNNYLDVASLLLKSGAKLDLKDSDGKVCVCVLCDKYATV